MTPATPAAPMTQEASQVAEPHGPIILLYHRVVELPTDPQSLAVSPANFAEQMDALRRTAKPIQLRELVSSSRENQPSAPEIVVTLDDGYADNLTNAKPILEAAEVPATVFVTAGYLGGACEFWWDELERLLLWPGKFQQDMAIRIETKTFDVPDSEGERYTPSQFEVHRRWDMTKATIPTLRHDAYRTLFRQLRALAQADRRRILDSLWDCSSEANEPRSTHLPLSPDEVVALAEGGIVEVGAHTMTHPVLARLDRADQRWEIQSSKSVLEEVLGRGVDLFSYPFGTRRDYSPDSVALVREAGYRAACANYADVVRAGTDPFQLPRIIVRDWDGDTLLSKIEEVRSRAA